MANRDDFVHLHLHTEYSLLDGACRIDRLMERLKRNGQSAAAITDHGVMYGCVDFYKEAKKNGIKPIIGCEMYVAPRTRFDKTPKIDVSPYHLVLLCKNETGYRNLIKLVSLSNIEGFYSRPRVDRELLERHHDGLIALSACLAGEIPQLILSDRYEEAKECALYYQNVFGSDSFYLEVQNHGIEEQRRVITGIKRLSEETGIQTVASNDCHYIERADSAMQYAMICVQTNRTVDDENELEFKTDQFFVKSTEEMSDLFADMPDAVTNTKKIADLCNFDFEFGVTKLPRFSAPDGADNAEYFERLCKEGLERRYDGRPGDEVQKRLDYEIRVIKSMGYVDYFLIVGDFVRFARSRDIPVGPGRGSGAGSLAAYCLGITGVDPIKYNLIFERFLNPDRVTMPDFDIDFCYERRQEVIDYVVERYGSNHVAQIITFGTLAARAAVRDIGRVLGMPYQDVDTVAKLIPHTLGITLSDALGSSLELKSLYDNNPEVKKLMDLAGKVEGMPRHASTHAAGVVITREEVSDYVPLQMNDEQVVTQFPMGTLEDLGLLKMDFLGLRTLTVIRDTEKSLDRNGITFSIDSVSYEDPKIYEMLSAGNTSGVFQFESAGMRQVLVGLKPVNLEDLIAVISLYRPGPMDSIPVYIRNRHNPEKITYKTPLLEPILNVTNGCIVYQEQVMQIFRDLAGFSLGQADIVRRAMSKKKADIMEKEGGVFIYGDDKTDGCLKRGIPENVSKEIFAEMESFASYAFNKSHAAAYAVVAYQTAYLKYYYPKEYMAALLTSVFESSDRVIEYSAECQRIGIEVAPPDVNASDSGFTVKDGKILFGLRAVKNVGRSLIRAITEERENKGSFSSFTDFCKRLHGPELNKRALENLIKCGALDGFNLSRRTMISNIDAVLKTLADDERRNIEGQFNLFENMSSKSSEDFYMENAPEYTRQELLAYEKEITGLYLSGHPLLGYKDVIDSVSNCTVRELLSDENGKFDSANITLVCSVASVRMKVTKANATMAFVTLEDLTGTIIMLVFPSKWDEYRQYLTENRVVVVETRVSVKEDEEVSLICNRVFPAGEYTGKKNAAVGDNVYAERKSSGRPAESLAPRKNALCLTVDDRSCEEYKRAVSLIQIFDGAVPVYIFIESENQWMLAPKKMWVTLTEFLTDELSLILGSENVTVRQK